jgi:hypothetical protein
MAQAILSIEDHAAMAAYHQAWAAAWHEQFELDREAAYFVGGASDQAALHASKARFHLFRALDLKAGA